MGYALLYESMLDSVLHARDRFLKPAGGIMAPSQTRMVLALCDPESVIKKRVGFWKNVYGFDMTCMMEGVYDEGIAEVVPPDAVLTSSAVVKVGSPQIMGVTGAYVTCPGHESASNHVKVAIIFLAVFSVGPRLPHQRSGKESRGAVLLDQARPEPRVCARFPSLVRHPVQPPGRDGAAGAAGEDALGGYGCGGCDQAAAAKDSERKTTRRASKQLGGGGREGGREERAFRSGDAADCD